MRRMRWITCVWPGLPQLWAHGSWSGLAVALGAAAVLDLLLVASFGWSELIGPSLRITLWAAVGVLWVVAAGWSTRLCRRVAAAGMGGIGEDTFAAALDHYLKGDYYQAEHLLDGLLRKNLRDVDARLMLATLMRRTGRIDDAKRQLDTLAGFEDAGKWQWEMRRERELLADVKASAAAA